MIDGKDLRIGNFLLLELMKCKVISISEDTKHSCYVLSLKVGDDIVGVNRHFFDRSTISHIFYKNGILYPAKETSLWGIPLTEKILLDSGFELYYENDFGKQFLFKKDSIHFYVVINGNKNTFAVKLEFALTSNIRCHETQFVHNLQNAYRLATGQDLDLIINDYSTTIP